MVPSEFYLIPKKRNMATYKFVGELVIVDFKTNTITERSADPETARDKWYTQQMRHMFDAWISGQRKAAPDKTLFETFRDNFMANYVNLVEFI